jgi:tetratricopeptide (TPR) repeat protein/ADP-heptose:LPS heptosyltransferase/glycosyltransferase involved in cell wall biosynthesis
MRGKVERVDNGCLVGWIQDEATPDGHIAFDIRLNGKPIGGAVADRLRSDLKNKNIGAGDHAFRFDIDAAVVLAEGDLISLHRTADAPLVPPLVLTAPMTERTVRPQEAIRLALETAKAQLKAGEEQVALDTLRQAAQRTPHRRLNTQMAKIHCQLGRQFRTGSEALAHFADATRLAPGNADIAYDYANALIDDGQTEAAIPVLATYADIEGFDSKRARMAFALGRLHKRAGRRDAAMAAFVAADGIDADATRAGEELSRLQLQAESLEPLDASALSVADMAPIQVSWSARLRMAAGRLKTILRPAWRWAAPVYVPVVLRFRAYLAQSRRPKELSAARKRRADELRDIGRRFHAESQTAAAIDAFSRAHGLNPGHAGIALDYAVTLNDSEQAEAVVAMVTGFVARSGTPRAHARLFQEKARALMTLDREPEAGDAYVDAVAHDPTLVQAAIEGADLLRRIKRFTDARKVLAQAADACDAQEGVPERIADRLVRLTPEAATAWYKESRRLKPTDPGGALKALAEAHALAPEDSGIAYDYGVALGAAGRIAEAIDLLATIRTEGVPAMRVALERGRLMIDTGKSEQALVVLNEAGFDDGEPLLSARLQAETGRALRRLDRIDAARDAFLRASDLGVGLTNAALEAADLMRRSGQAEAALDLLARFQAARPKTPASFLRVRMRVNLTLGRDADVRTDAESLATSEKLPVDWFVAHALDESGRREEAIPVYELVLSATPAHTPSLLNLGRIYLQTRRPELALHYLNRAAEVAPDNSDVWHGIGIAHRQMTNFPAAEAAFARALDLVPHRLHSLLDLAELRHIRGDLDGALQPIAVALTFAPSNVRALLGRASITYEKGELEASVRDCEAALVHAPDNAKAQAQLAMVKASLALPNARKRIDLCFLSPDATLSGEDLEGLSGLFEAVFAPSGVAGLPADVSLCSGGADWREILYASTADYTLVVTGMATEADIRTVLARIGVGVGLVTLDDRFSLAAWDRDCLEATLSLNPDRDYVSFAGAARHKLNVRLAREADMPALTRASGAAGQGEEIWLVSSSGINLFGGVERFLRSLVPVYRSLGFTPVIVGLLENSSGPAEEGEVDDIPYINLARDPASIRRLALQRGPVIVHTTTGIGHEVTSALSGVNARVIHGTHFWREMFYGHGSFENVDLNGRPRPEFGVLCARAAQVYANSSYTRDVIAGHFGMMQPVVYSLPFDVDAKKVVKKPGGYALLMNGRPDKGLPLVIEAAKRVPHIMFRIVASQVSADRVRELIEAAGVAENVEVVGWAEDTDALYKGARAVLVPSYAFVETFSRVTIEAQRFGVPVVGSDRGNVKVLLEDSGAHLPEDPDAWAAELDRLFTDDAYWRKRSKAARVNSDHYLHAHQEKRVERLVRTAKQRIAIGVGSGIGNIIQTTPAIRHVAEYYGAPVDIILRQDFPGCESLFRGSEWVGSVMPADTYASLTRFDAVLLLDCFGKLIPHFNTDRLHVARRHFDFAMTRTMHEAEFYLMSAAELLGIPYTKADATKYFVGDWAQKAVPGRIGVHAGCKDGIWLAKRWPYYAELIDILQAKGYEVHSFGSPDEYVPGTVDRTGTDLETSISNIASCSYFLANDSGLMHIADALDVPLTTIFAPTSVAKNGPLRPTSRVYRVNKGCSPCQFDSDKLATCVCIGEIPLAEVAEGVLADLAALAAPASGTMKAPVRKTSTRKSAAKAAEASPDAVSATKTAKGKTGAAPARKPAIRKPRKVAAE